MVNPRCYEYLRLLLSVILSLRSDRTNKFTMQIASVLPDEMARHSSHPTRQQNFHGEVSAIKHPMNTRALGESGKAVMGLSILVVVPQGS